MSAKKDSVFLKYNIPPTKRHTDEIELITSNCRLTGAFVKEYLNNSIAPDNGLSASNISDTG